MSGEVDLVVIKGDWHGGHHGKYPKVFSIDLSSPSPFSVSEGSGWGLGGGNFTLAELFERNIASIFNREESAELFKKLSLAYQEGADSHELARELMKEYGGNA